MMMRPITLYNSLTQKKERFQPIQPGEVSLYVCGPTVYGDVHIGNMRPVVVFDVLRRFFEHVGYHVHYVSNYTDIDDKIIQKALQVNQSETELATRYIEAYEQNVLAVGSLLPHQTPKVTDHLHSIIRFIESLLAQDYAYLVDGDVYFRVNKIQTYGELSGMNIDRLQSGARVDDHQKKENPLDFALWKKTDIGVSFPSSFGEGRPGWHTECVVMIKDSFHQDKIDIHGGGFDLKFPHHENEIAQHRAHHDNALASIWMHNGFINLNDEKMSKSTGTLVLAKDFIARYGGTLLRYVLLSTHYRIPVNFTDEIIANAANELEKIQTGYRKAAIHCQRWGLSLDGKQDHEAFLDALADDVNTANALTSLHQEIKLMHANLRTTPLPQTELLNRFFTISTMLSILGLTVDYPILSAEDRQLFQSYEAAKLKKDYASSDKLRDELVAKGLFL
jgi:cysteinyl-tRNA synthetase